MSDPRDFTVTLAVGIVSKIEARGRFFGIIEAPLDALDVQLDSRAPLRRGPGGSILLSEFFSRVALTSATAQSVRVLIADESQDVSNVVTGGGGGGGGITVEETPSTVIATPDDNAIAAAATENIAANAARKRITIGVLSTADDPIRVQAVGANDASGIEVQPGTFVEIRTTASLDIRCNGAIGSVYYIFEES